MDIHLKKTKSKFHPRTSHKGTEGV